VWKNTSEAAGTHENQVKTVGLLSPENKVKTVGPLKGVLQVIAILAARSTLNVILSEVSNANEVERISDSFAQSKPVPVLWVGVPRGYSFREFQTQDTSEARPRT
jgi:hypothetical protein